MWRCTFGSSVSATPLGAARLGGRGRGQGPGVSGRGVECVIEVNSCPVGRQSGRGGRKGLRDAARSVSASLGALTALFLLLRALVDPGRPPFIHRGAGNQGGGQAGRTPFKPPQKSTEHLLIAPQNGPNTMPKWCGQMATPCWHSFGTVLVLIWKVFGGLSGWFEGGRPA